MEQSSSLTAFDIASPWLITGTPVTVDCTCPEASGLDTVMFCLECGKEMKEFEDKGEANLPLKSLLNPECQQWNCCAECRVAAAGSRKIRIPWARPGTGCTLMFEALVMALVRKTSVKAAATIFASCDPRLWRLADYRGSGGKSSSSIENTDSRSAAPGFGKNPPKCLSLFQEFDPQRQTNYP
jgi:hypothetical protein